VAFLFFPQPGALRDSLSFTKLLRNTPAVDFYRPTKKTAVDVRLHECTSALARILREGAA